jgi:hypothetical protein
MRILFLGSNHENTAKAYQNFNVDASVLVNSINQVYSIGHTSRQEFSSDSELEEILSAADLVFWTFPKETEFLNLNEFVTLLEWLKKYQLKYGNIKNFQEIKFDLYRWNDILPTLTDNDIVFLGCSFTAGTALPGPVNNRYANIVAKHFKKNCVNLSMGGGSNSRSFDIFGQLDFQKNQIVVLQLTGLERLRYIDDNKNKKDMMFTSLNKQDIEAFTKIYHKDFLFYELLSRLKISIRYAREKELRLVFWLIDYKNKELFSLEDQTYFYNFPEFVPGFLLADYLVDFGIDNLHPGIQSNRIIADALITHIENIYEI